MIEEIKFRFKQSWISIDQMFNAVIFGGWADETMSSNLYRMDQQGKLAGVCLRPVVDFIARVVFCDENHCERSFVSERLRLQSPPEER